MGTGISYITYTLHEEKGTNNPKVNTPKNKYLTIQVAKTLIKIWSPIILHDGQSQKYVQVFTTINPV